MRPNLFLLAAPRAGSTQLAHWLASHPDIGIPPVKEPNFFSSHEFCSRLVAREGLNDIDPEGALPPRHPAQFAVFRRAQDYARLYRGLHMRWRLDASTSYLACPEAPNRIAASLPRARALCLTRDPVERALSHYRLALRTGRTRRPLTEELADELAGRTPLAARFLLRPSDQAAGLARVATAFPGRHLALRFEELIADPRPQLDRIAAFLDIDPAGFDLDVRARNAGVAPRFAGLNHLLHRTGLRTPLRRALPPALKPALKRLVFTRHAAAIDPADRAALERLL